jgi:enterochelin esterase-like enzyme
MKVLNILFFTLLCVTQSSFGQEYSFYSNDSLILTSDNLNETIRLHLHLPETFNYSSDSTKYPVTIIFDSQHERTYPHIISSFDLLTNETQIPETIIIGVPFNMNNRYYFTSAEKKENDVLTGIERMENFLFSELIPKLQKEFKANDFISVIGHSRTAFLVNYLAVKKSKEINVAIALSGFFNNLPLSLDSFQSFLVDSTNFPKPFRYYYTAGTTLEEKLYLDQYKELDNFVSKTLLPAKLHMHFEGNLNANHITNYWVSIPTILIDAYSDYNAILDNWFYEKLKQKNIENPVLSFESDLANAGEKMGFKPNPNLTHIFSLASHFGYAREDYKTALSFIKLGLKYFPDYLDFYIEGIEYYRLLDDNEKVNEYKSVLKEKALSSKHLNDTDRNDLLKYLDK